MRFKMAAPSLSAKEAKKAVKKPKKPVAKSILCNPYDAKWPLVKDEDKEAIIAKFKIAFDPLNLAMPKLLRRKQKNKSEPNTERVERVRQLTEDEKHLRSQLVMGINEVTRALEKDQLRLVVTERDCQPAMLTRHLVALSTSRQCPAVCIPKLRESVAKSLGIKSLVALGFKKLETDDLPYFTELVTLIAEKAPSIQLPWMNEKLAMINKVDTTLVNMTKHQEGTHTATDKAKPPWEQSGQTVPSELNSPKILSSASKDYSYLYIYKSDPRARKKKFTNFGADFLAFGKDSDEELQSDQCEIVVPHVKVKQGHLKGKKRKGVDKKMKSQSKKRKLEARKNATDYKNAKLGKMQANLQRNQRKLKR